MWCVNLSLFPAAQAHAFIESVCRLKQVVVTFIVSNPKMNAYIFRFASNTELEKNCRKLEFPADDIRVSCETWVLCDDENWLNVLICAVAIDTPTRTSSSSCNLAQGYNGWQTMHPQSGFIVLTEQLSVLQPISTAAENKLNTEKPHGQFGRTFSSTIAVLHTRNYVKHFTKLPVNCWMQGLVWMKPNICVSNHPWWSDRSSGVEN